MVICNFQKPFNVTIGLRCYSVNMCVGHVVYMSGMGMGYKVYLSYMRIGDSMDPVHMVSCNLSMKVKILSQKTIIIIWTLKYKI